MKDSKAFTLIELLIVIGVLGILAAGLLAAVDPFEQLKKGRDTNRRNIVVELHNAMIRYYATHGSLPWDNGTVCDTVYADADAAVNLEAMNGGETTVASGCIAPIITDGELKADYISGVGSGDLEKYYIYSATGVDLSICFAPESKSFFQDSAAKWSPDGLVDRSATVCSTATKASTTTVPAHTDVANACFWCAK